MGSKTLKHYAKASYGQELTDMEVESLSQAWFESFPEMEYFLRGSEPNLGSMVATLFDLKQTHRGSFHESSSDEWRNGFSECTDDQQGILGWMLLKVAKTENPSSTNSGKAYRSTDVDYLWKMIQQKKHLLPNGLHGDIDQCRPSESLARAIRKLADTRSVFTHTGRLRAGANYTARHNTVFQGLAADGAKLALWALWRAGFRIVNFIHDEVIVEVPDDSQVEERAEQIRQIMIESMRQVVPDVRVDVEYTASRAWSKEAKSRDADGKFTIWSPAKKEGVAAPSTSKGSNPVFQAQPPVQSL